MKKKNLTSRSNDRGATLVEYGLLAGLVAIASIASVATSGEEIRHLFAGFSKDLAGAEQVEAIEETPQAPGGVDFPEAAMVLAFEGPEVAVQTTLASGSATGEILWGDGTRTALTQTGTSNHRFASEGVNYVGVIGDIASFRSDSDNLVEVVRWGDLPLKNLESAFLNDAELVAVPTSIPPSITSLRSAFAMTNAGPGPNPEGLETWDTSAITVMTEAFKNNTSFDRDLANWDVSNTTNSWMNGLWAMFSGATGYSGDLSSWCVSHYSESPSFGAPNAAHAPVWGYCGKPEGLSEDLVLTFAGDTVRLYIDTGSQEGALVQWGDGSASSLPTSSAEILEHVYADAGPHQVTVQGEVEKLPERQQQPRVGRRLERRDQKSQRVLQG